MKSDSNNIMNYTKEWLRAYEERQAKAVQAYWRGFQTHEASSLRPTNPKPEPPVLDGPLAEEEVEGRDTRRRITVTSYRVRLLDQDNLCIKYHIDGLRYNGVIEDDTTKHIVITERQVQVATRKEERTEIEVT